MLQKMMLVSHECFERLHRHDYEDDVDNEARNEKRQMRALLEKKDAHPYDRWVKLREVQDPIHRRAQKKRRSVTLRIYATEDGEIASHPRCIDAGIQTYESGDESRKIRRPITIPTYVTEDGGTAGRPRSVDTETQIYESGEEGIGDFVVPEDEEIARFGDTHSGR
jgi:hypothetical protein